MADGLSSKFHLATCKTELEVSASVGGAGRQLLRSALLVALVADSLIQTTMAALLCLVL